MRTLCQPVDGICTQCGEFLPKGLHRSCSAGPSPEPTPTVTAARPDVGLGDRVEQALSAVGVTKERWIAAKEKLGLPPSCNCDLRQEWLNKVGEELGAKAKEAAAGLWGQVIRLKNRAAATLPEPTIDKKRPS